VLRLQQQQKAKNSPGLFHLRDELIQVVMRRVRQLKKPRIPLPRQLSIIPGEITCPLSMPAVGPAGH